MSRTNARTRTTRVKKILSSVGLGHLKVTSSRWNQVTYVHLGGDPSGDFQREALEALDALAALGEAFPLARVDLSPGNFVHVQWAPGL